MSRSSYVLVTPTRNNEATIGQTIMAVASQTHPPVRWIIVSDGSTDATDDVVRAGMARFPFLDLLRVDHDRTKGFASKVAAFNAGYAALAGVAHDYVGNLDADVTFDPTYFERLLAVLDGDHRLGIAGGTIVERNRTRTRRQRTSPNSVAGAVQLFRRDCFAETGGFAPLPGGGEDASAEIMARLQGWKVRTVADLEVVHHGRVGTRNGSALRAAFARGRTNYLLGYDPVFQLGVSCYRMADPPYVVGGVLMMAGFGWNAWRRPERALPQPAMAFLRREQRARVRSIAARTVQACL